MAGDDFRIRVHVEDDPHSLLERLGFGLSDEAAELARELAARRFVVSRDGEDVFVYAASYAEAERARSVIQAELGDSEATAVTSDIERWIDEEDRWSNEPPAETWEREAVDHGYAPWEVRVELGSHHEAKDLADRLEREGFGVERRWQYVLVGVGTKEEAEKLAERVHGEVEPGGELVWETVPGNPFAVFGGLGGSGAPVG
jgi:hypothetical protein